MTNTFFTADSHFSHTNIIKYSNRPFKDATEMNETLIRKWNDKIPDSDSVVYFLGDFAFCSQNDAQKIFDRLNGQKHLIIGNHDKSGVQIHGWKSKQHYLEVTVNKQFIVLCHYAMRVWNRSHHGAWQLYGHSHGSLPDDPYAKSFDVGVDCWNYTPLSFDDVERVMRKKETRPVDHHGQR